MLTWYGHGVSRSTEFRELPVDPDPLIGSLIRGEASAIRLVYQTHQGVVRAFVWRLLGNQDEVEDLVQETFLALPQALQRFRGESSLRTFLISIAAHRAKQRLRSRTRRLGFLDRLRRDRAPEEEVLTPEQTLEAGQLARALRAGMHLLSVDQRIAFVLCDVEERSSAEAAEILDIPASTVRDRLRAARSILRVHLEKAGVR